MSSPPEGTPTGMATSRASGAGSTLPILQARGITKRFGHVEALRGVDFDARAGEVTALIGDNGAGKSTLVKILSGVYGPTTGELSVDGATVSFNSPATRMHWGSRRSTRTFRFVRT